MLSTQMVCADRTTKMTKPNNDILIDRKGLAARWNVSIPTIKRMEARGELSPVHISERVVRYRLEDIERIEAANQKGGK